MASNRLTKWWKGQSVGSQNLIRGVFGLSLGALSGFAYYYFVGCSTGSCPITSNPMISTAWGAAIGGVLALR